VNLLESLAQRFPADPSRPFLETADGRVFSYADLLAWSARFANGLAQAGVRPGDRVVVQVEKSPFTLFLYLGCLRAGAVYVPLNTAYTDPEVAYFLEDAEPAVVVRSPDRPGLPVTPPGLREALTLADSTGTAYELAEASDAVADTVKAEHDDLAAILYTSGTTGRSKGAMLTHENLRSNAFVLCDAWGFGPDDVLLHALPVYHTHGLFVATHCALASGSSLLFLPRFDLGEVLRLLPRATVMMGVPTFYVRLLESPELTADTCSRMRLFVSGSAPLLPETFARFRERTGHTILERYGMTETNMNTSNPLVGERRAGTVGPPLPGVELRVVKEDGTPARGEPGIIHVRGPNVFKGYWRNPEKTREDLREDGFFVTGDVGVVDDDGYVTIVGRAKDLVISGGLNVYPREVEEAIDAIPGVEESAVVGVPHADLGEAVVAVVRANGAADVSEELVLAELSGRLARFKQPKRVFLVDEIPRNAMGKVLKEELRRRYADTFAG
jgi:malonyl-CoA/methylmalonyl-CoA synthetase